MTNSAMRNRAQQVRDGNLPDRAVLIRLFEQMVLLRRFAAFLEYQRVPFGNRLDLGIATTSPLPPPGTLR